MTLSVADAEEYLRKVKQGDSGLQVTICGGGNGAHVAAGYLSHKGIRVNVLTRKPQQWGEQITVTTEGSSWKSRGPFVGRLNSVSKNAATVIPGSKVVIVAAPANAHPEILKTVAPYLEPGVFLGALFAQGGFDWAAKAAVGDLDRLGVVFGLQNIPWICKATKYGNLPFLIARMDQNLSQKPYVVEYIAPPSLFFDATLRSHTAKIIGPKKCLFVACYPVEKSNVAVELMADLFDIPCKPVRNFLSLTLTPSNQIIHPARYYGIFRDWDGKKTYSKSELAKRKGLTLYADMDEFSAEQLAMLDNELQQIKFALLKRFPALDLSDVLPLDERVIKHYSEDVSDRSSLRQIFATNLGYAGCATPLKEVGDDQYIPATESRLFWEDIPFGLCILKSMAEMLGDFPTPRIDFFIRWHQQYMGIEFLLPDGHLNPKAIEYTGAPYKYGIHSVRDLVQTSLPVGMQDYVHPMARL